MDFRVRTRRGLAPLALGLALVAAGCGGSSSDKNANDAYADSVCGAIATWEQQVKTIATDLSGGVSAETLQAKETAVENATTALVAQIKAIPAPDSSQGQAASEQISKLSDDVTAIVNTTKSAITGLGASPSAAQVATTVAMLAVQYQSLVPAMQSSLSAIKDAGGDIAKSFENSSTCKSLT